MGRSSEGVTGRDARRRPETPMAQDGSFATIVIEGRAARDLDYLASFDGIYALVETLRALFRQADVDRTGLADGVRIRSLVLMPETKVILQVPAAAEAVRWMLSSVSLCMEAAAEEGGAKLRPHEKEMAGTLAALLGGGGWASVKIALVEDDWESLVLVVPSELRTALARLMPRPVLAG